MGIRGVIRYSHCIAKSNTSFLLGVRTHAYEPLLMRFECSKMPMGEAMFAIVEGPCSQPSLSVAGSGCNKSCPELVTYRR